MIKSSHLSFESEVGIDELIMDMYRAASQRGMKAERKKIPFELSRGYPNQGLMVDDILIYFEWQDSGCSVSTTGNKKLLTKSFVEFWKKFENEAISAMSQDGNQVEEISEDEWMARWIKELDRLSMAYDEKIKYIFCLAVKKMFGRITEAQIGHALNKPINELDSEIKANGYFVELVKKYLKNPGLWKHEDEKIKIVEVASDVKILTKELYKNWYMPGGKRKGHVKEFVSPNMPKAA